jgi:hypothetical protein
VGGLEEEPGQVGASVVLVVLADLQGAGGLVLGIIA